MQKILMVDDDAQVVAVLHTALEALGHHVTVCTDALDAERVCEKLQPNLVLLDLMMPGKSGLELVNPINHICPDAIVCLVTGLNDPDVLQKSMKAGAWSVLYKPYSLSDLADLIALAEQLSAAIHNESKIPTETDTLAYSWKGSVPLDPEAVSAIVQFAQQHVADTDVATRRLPLIAIKLLSNAHVHGVCGNAEKNYGIELKDRGKDFLLSVYHDGENFNWRKEISRLSFVSGNGKASGLQLVKELADELNYEDNGRRANAVVTKHSRS